MAINDAAAAARAAAEARRRAEEARRRAEEAARRKAAAEAAKKAAQAAAKKAAAAAAKKTVSPAEKKLLSAKAEKKTTASAVRQAFGKDEVSKGLGRALRERSLTALGGAQPKQLTIEELRASRAQGLISLANKDPKKTGLLTTDATLRSAADVKLGDAVARTAAVELAAADVKKAQLAARDVRSADAAERAAAVKKTLTTTADAAERAALSKKPATFISPDAAERAALAKRPASYMSPDAADRAAAASGTTPTPPTPEERAAQGARDVQKAWDDTISRGGNEAEAAAAASKKLEDLTASNDIAYNNALLRSSQPTLEKIADVVGKNAGDDGFTGDADKAQVKAAIKSLSNAATESGEIGSFLIGDALAKKIPDESELMHVDDAFYEHADAGGGPELMAALGARLDAYGKGEAKDELFDRHDKGWLESAWDATGGAVIGAAGDFIGAVGDAAGAVVGFVGDAAEGALRVVGKAGEMAVDVAKGTVELAGNAAEWTAEQVTEAAEYAAKNGLKLAGAALNWVGDHARELAAEALNIDGQIASLNSPGDTVTMAVGGKVGLTAVQGGAEVEMKITKTEDGYEMQLTGELSAGVFGGLKLPGFPSAEGEANATGVATATMKFDSLDEVTTAAETIGGIGVATAVGGPAGALLTGATAADEISDIVSHFESGSVGLELSAEAKASLGETAGIGAGGSISGAVTTGVRLEITKGQPPALVLEQGLEASGSLALGAPVDIPSLGGKLNGGSIDGSATIQAETRVPLPADLDLGDVVSDPVGAMKEVGQNVLDNTTTKLSLGVDVHAGIATEGLPINLGSNGGLEINLSGEAKTKDLVGALGLALKGDLSGALKQLGTKTELDVSVASYTESGFDIEEEVSVPGFSFEVKAQDEVRDTTELWAFEGTPAELAREGFNLFDALQLNVR